MMWNRFSPVRAQIPSILSAIEAERSGIEWVC